MVLSHVSNRFFGRSDFEISIYGLSGLKEVLTIYVYSCFSPQSKMEKSTHGNGCVGVSSRRALLLTYLREFMTKE